MFMPVPMKIIINLGTYTSLFYLVFVLLNQFTRSNWLSLLVKLLCGTAISTLIVSVISNEFEEIVLILVCYGLCMVIFKKDLYHFKRTFEIMTAIFLSYVIVMLSTTITTLFVVGYAQYWLHIKDMLKIQFTWPMVAAIMVIQISIVILAGRLVKRIYKVIKAYSERYGLRMTIMILTGLALLVITFSLLVDEFIRIDIPGQYVYLVVGTMLILVVFVIVGMLFYSQAVIRQNKVALERENQRNLTLYVEQLERNYREIRKFRHDIANALLTLETIINEHGDVSLTNDYHDLLTHYQFDTIQNHAIGHFQEINNAYLKGIIFSKYIEARNKRISFNLEVQPDLFEEKQQYFDELRLLGIFLDNAIDAVQQQGSGEITVSLFKQACKMVYRIKNTAQDPVAFGNIYQLGYSTKGPNRGIGLATAKEITDARNDFQLILKQEDHDFIAMLVVELEEAND